MTHRLITRKGGGFGNTRISENISFVTKDKDPIYIYIYVFIHNLSKRRHFCTKYIYRDCLQKAQNLLGKFENLKPQVQGDHN